MLTTKTPTGGVWMLVINSALFGLTITLAITLATLGTLFSSPLTVFGLVALTLFSMYMIARNFVDITSFLTYMTNKYEKLFRTSGGNQFLDTYSINFMTTSMGVVDKLMDALTNFDEEHHREIEKNCDHKCMECEIFDNADIDIDALDKEARLQTWAQLLEVEGYTVIEPIASEQSEASTTIVSEEPFPTTAEIADEQRTIEGEDLDDIGVSQGTD